MKTTDLLTFFQSAKSDGTTWTFPLRNSDGLVAQIWVFSRGDENLSRFANAAASTEEEFKSLLKELQGVVQPRGGIVLYAYDHNGMIRASPYLVGAQGYALPQRLLRLSPIGDPSFENITDPIDLDVGDHLIIPVSKDAETRLKAFHQDVQDLPSDLQSSVFNVIRRPSLEWRIERIERTLSLKPATRFDQQRSQARKGKLLDRLSHLFMWPIPIGPVIAAALLLMAGSLFAYDRFFRPPTTEGAPSGEDSTAQETPDQAPAEETPRPIETPRPEPNDPKSAFDALFWALNASEDPSIQGLFKFHFKDHQKDGFKALGVSWGTTKLQALQLGLLTKDSLILNDVDAWSGTEKIYRDGKNLNLLEKNVNAVAVLAYTWCQQNNAPDLPATPQYTKPLPLKSTCNDVKPDDVVSGLAVLTDWVKRQKEPKK
ncbi:MAG TPA: hypothetical protein VGS07_18725 [Thermoanaerobaculia bacterium]|jgi:hypothetical protein|nr:hypothetical protein [Thermoanaerobaculia bacterium]